MNSYLDRSPGSIPAGWEMPRFHSRISLWKPYLSFSHCLQRFWSRRMRRRMRRDLQRHPSGHPPRPTHQPCPGEGAAEFGPFSPSNERPQQWPFAGGQPAPLPAPAGIGSAGKRVTVKELFKPQCLCKYGFNFRPLGFVAAFLFMFIFFPLAPLEYTTMISSLSFGEYIYISYIQLNGPFSIPVDH